jgi:hypothetical protein
VRGKQDAPAKGLSRESDDGIDGRKRRKVEKGNGKTFRIWQRLEDKPEIGFYYTLRHNIRIGINGKPA